MSNNLKEVREKLINPFTNKCYTQAEMGEKIGVNDKTLRKYEHGDDTNMQVGSLKALANMWAEAESCEKKSIDFLLGLTDYESINGEAIAEITGLSDKAISRLQTWNTSHGGYNPFSEYTQGLSLILEAPVGKNIIKAILQYLYADASMINKINAVNMKTGEEIEIKDIDPAQTTVEFENYGDTFISTIMNPSLLRTDALAQIKECLDIIKRDYVDNPEEN